MISGLITSNKSSAISLHSWYFPVLKRISILISDKSKNFVFVVPDNGATGRRNVYLNSFNSKYIHREAGSFVK